MTFDEIIHFLPPPERLWHLLIDLRNWLQGPLSFDEKEKGNINYLQGMFSGFDYILYKLLSDQNLTVEDIIQIHDLVMQDPSRKWSNYLSYIAHNIYFPIANPTPEGETQRNFIIRDLNTKLKINKISYRDPDKEGYKIYRMPNKSYTNEAISKELLETIASYLNILNTVPHHLSNDEKIIFILDNLLPLEYLHPFPDGNARTFLILIFNYYLIKNHIYPVPIFDTEHFESYSTHEILPMIKYCQQRLQKPCNFWELENHREKICIYFNVGGQGLHNISQYMAKLGITIDPQTICLTLANIIESRGARLPISPEEDTLLAYHQFLSINTEDAVKINSSNFPVAASNYELYWTLLNSKQSVLYFLDLLIKNEQFKNRICQNIDLFLKVLLTPSPDRGISPFYLIINFLKANKYFFKFLDNNPEIKNMLLLHPLFIPALCVMRFNYDQEGNTPALFWLLREENGKKWFLSILQIYPELKEKLLAENQFIFSLCQFMYPHGIGQEEVAMVYYFLNDQKLIQLFMEFLTDSRFLTYLKDHPYFPIMLCKGLKLSTHKRNQEIISDIFNDDFLRLQFFDILKTSKITDENLIELELQSNKNSGRVNLNKHLFYQNFTAPPNSPAISDDENEGIPSFKDKS